jgi:hypothetical protein
VWKSAVEQAGGFCSYALLDRATGEITVEGSDRSTTQSMIKSWIVADFLRDRAEASEEELAQGAAAIIDSDDDATEALYQAGGGDAMIERLISIAGLTDTTIEPGWWSMTSTTASDAARMGLAIADGRAAGPKWTPWVLDRMREVRGDCTDEEHGGRWGVIDGLPNPNGLAIKNGWTRMSDGQWDVNCLALHQDWVLAVLMGYPGELPLQFGADIAKQVTQQLMSPAQPR